MDTSQPRPLVGLQHVALTVTDVDVSVAWYRRVLGLDALATLPHEGGYGILLATPDQGLFLVLHHHDDNDGAPATEVRTGLDHVGLLAHDLGELERWRAWFVHHGVNHSPITPLDDFNGSVLVFRDPDNIQLELYAPDPDS